jgi:hypothetical protein
VPTPEEKTDELDSSWPEANDGELRGSESPHVSGVAAAASGGVARSESEEDDGGAEVVYDEVRAENARDFVEDMLV